MDVDPQCVCRRSRRIRKAGSGSAADQKVAEGKSPPHPHTFGLCKKQPVLLTVRESRMGGFQEGGFQIVERAAFSSCGNLLLQGNSYLKSTLRLLLRRRV